MEAEGRFCKAALGVLEHLPDQDTARGILQSNNSKRSTLGTPNGEAVSNLNLAIMNKNKDFVAHRYCQGIADDMWLGKTEHGGRLRMKAKTSLIWLVAQVLLPFFNFIHLTPNELYRPRISGSPPTPDTDPTPSERQIGTTAALNPTAMERARSIWYIPLLKVVVQFTTQA
eukprot:5956541-Pleurochrysis_carterae.AAC.1